MDRPSRASVRWQAVRLFKSLRGRQSWGNLVLIVVLLSLAITLPARAMGPAFLVKDINPTVNAGVSLGPPDLAGIGNVVYFGADDGSTGRELWKSDGTEAGTSLVKDINPRSTSALSCHCHQTDVSGVLFFAANDGSHGVELWRSDGTSEGTTLVKDIRPGSTRTAPQESRPSLLTSVDGTLFFTAVDGIHGRELWKSDGTTAGTTLVKDIWPGSIGSTPTQFVNVNGTLFFIAHDGSKGEEL